MNVIVIPFHNSFYSHHEESPASASGVKEPFVGVSIVSYFVENIFSEPIGRVKFAEVVPYFSRQKFVIKFFQKVPRLHRIRAYGGRIIIPEFRDKHPQSIGNLAIPDIHIPREQVTLDKVYIPYGAPY